MKRTGKLIVTWTLIAVTAFPMTVGAAGLSVQTETGMEDQALPEDIVQESEGSDQAQEAEAPDAEGTPEESTTLDKTETEGGNEDPAAEKPDSTSEEDETDPDKKNDEFQEPGEPVDESQEPGEPVDESQDPEVPIDSSQDFEGTEDEPLVPEEGDAVAEETQEDVSNENWGALTLIEDRVVESDELFVQAGRHGTISVNPLMYDKVYSNNTKIQLKFTLRSFGNAMDEYRIMIYKGKSVPADGEALDGEIGLFDKTVGEHEITLEWDTTDVNKFKEGTYTIQCIALYKEKVETGGTRSVESSHEEFNVTLEDYKTVATRNFVRRLYTKVLNRSAEDKGLKDWTDKLVKKQVTGGEAVRGFIQSREFVNRGLSDSEYVDVLYQTLFDRDADAEGKENWLDALNTGMSRTFVLKGFVDGAEFHALCNSYGIQRGTIKVTENRDKNRGATGFVWRFYQVALGRTPDIAGLNDWTGKLVGKKSTPEEIGRGFIFSAEVRNKNLSNEDYVELLYRTFLDREPDETGLADWVNRLDSGTRREAVFNGFSRSVEFGRIVSSFGL